MIKELVKDEAILSQVCTPATVSYTHLPPGLRERQGRKAIRVVHAKNRYSVPLQLDPAFAGSFLSLLS